MESENQVVSETNQLQQALQKRNAELLLLSSIQEALLTQKEMPYIFELVGNSLHEMFNGYVVSIALLDRETATEYFKYHFEEGKKISWKDGFHAIYCILRYSIFK